jgi:ABC-type sugar transport system permease subunit
VVSGIVKASKGTRSGYWMALPALLAILALVAYPLAFATYYSLMRILPGLPGEFIGFENYSRMLEDPHFTEALRTTVLFTAASGGLSFLAGLGLALLLSKAFAGRGRWRWPRSSMPGGPRPSLRCCCWPG